MKLLWRQASRVLICTAMLMAAAAQAREVRVGVYQNEPKIYWDEQQGRAAGIFIDLFDAMAREKGWTPRYVPCAWQDCLAALDDGHIDLLPDVAWTEARARQYSFHQQPALHSWSQIFRHPDVDVTTIFDLKGQRIAVLRDSIQAAFFRNQIESFGLKVELLPVDSLAEGFKAVADGKAVGVIANHRYGERHAQNYHLLPTPIVFQPAALYFAAGGGRNADLLQAIDELLVPWQRNPGSPYFEILRRWGQQAPEQLVPRYVWWGLAALLALLVASLAVGFWLRRQVRIRTLRLRESEERLAAILDSVDAYIYIKDRDLRYEYANQRVCEALGRPLNDILGRTDEDFFDAVTVRKLRVNDARVIEHGERVAAEEINTSQDGRATRTYLSIKVPLRREDGRVYALCGISTDITERKAAEEEIQRLAFYDPLTGLPNRRLMMDRLQHALASHARQAHTGALLFIDLDHFKVLNDTLGHDMGDQWLQEVEQRLSMLVRKGDTLARLGGDEFVLLLENLNPVFTEAAAQAEVIARKILQAVQQPWMPEGQVHHGSCSIGVTLFHEPINVDELLKRADLAMYEAKAEGRGTLRFFDPAMQIAVSQRAQMESALREGLEQGQFHLHYQPQTTADGRLIGAEALIRWQRPGRGWIAPGEFIATAESSNLILVLGRWVLAQACSTLKSWAERPALASLALAVNVSARQFRDPGFVADLRLLLAESGAPASRLKLEITESLLIEDVDEMVKKMAEIQSLGVRFALDDFGTGYSSLAYLQQLPLEQLKIDRSFVRDLESNANDAAIARTIVALAHSLELQVVAEGVETEAQRELLRQMGCDAYQGYLFGRPEERAVLERRLETDNADTVEVS